VTKKATSRLVKLHLSQPAVPVQLLSLSAARVLQNCVRGFLNQPTLSEGFKLDMQLQPTVLPRSWLLLWLTHRTAAWTCLQLRPEISCIRGASQTSRKKNQYSGKQNEINY